MTPEEVEAVVSGDIPLGELTDAERVALPPAMHQPFYDGLGKPHSWICAVCWGDGWQTSWPCEIATRSGVEVARAAHLDYVS